MKKLLRAGTGEVDLEAVRTQWPEELELDTKFTEKALADEVREMLRECLNVALCPAPLDLLWHFWQLVSGRSSTCKDR